MKNVIRKIVVLFALVACVVATFVGAVTKNAVFDGYSNVFNVDYDMNFISIERAKALFSPSFEPLMPAYDFLDDSYFESQYVEGTLGDKLLEKQYNYYISINNPDKKFFSERPIYESYSMTISTPTVWDNPSFYGLDESDLSGYSHESVWISYDYLLEKLDGYENKEQIANSILGYAEKQNYDDWNDMPYYHIFDEQARVSYVTFSAYSDTIAKKVEEHNYPRTLKYTQMNSNQKKCTPLNQFYVREVLVNARLVEDKVMAINPSALLEYFGNEKEDNAWIYDANCFLLKTYVTANFRIDDINYSLIIPLMNRLISYNSTDYGSQNASDYPKLREVATKTISHFIQVLREN